MGGFDEPHHWFRASEIAEGRLLARALGPNDWGDVLGGGRLEFGLAPLPSLLSSRPVSRAQLEAEARSLAAHAPAPSLRSFPSTASFPPLAYVPAAAGILLAHAVSCNPFTAYGVGRLVQTAVYFALLLVAGRLFPAGAPFLLGLMLAPTNLHLATSFNADPMCNALGAVLLFALSRSRVMPAADAREPANALSFLTAICLGALKLTYVFLLPAMLLRFWGCGRRSRSEIGLALLACLLTATFAVWWNLRFPFVPGSYWHSGAEPAAGLRQVAAFPIRTLGLAWHSVADHLFLWWKDADVRFGGAPGPYHFWASPAFAALDACLLLGLAASRQAAPDWRAATICAGVAVLYLGALLLAFRIAYTPPQATAITGLQGRYFTPVVMLAGLFVLFACPSRRRLPPRVANAGFLGLLLSHTASVLHAIVQYRGLYA